MKIYFDIEVKYIDRLERLSDKSKYLLQELKRFITQRFDVFKDEIEQEETDHDAYIVFVLLESPMFLSFTNFSDPLRQKMSESFTEDDMNYITMKIVTELQYPSP